MTQYVMQTIAAGYLVQAIVTFVSSAAAFLAIILIWRRVARGDAQRALEGQEEAAGEIQRLKAALWDSQRLVEHHEAQLRAFRRLAQEARNHNRNWNARASSALMASVERAPR